MNNTDNMDDNGMDLPLSAWGMIELMMAVVCAFGVRSFDCAVHALCKLTYTMRARLVCGNKYVRMVAARHGPAIARRPGPAQVNIVDMRGPGNERVKIITRGRGSPEWTDVDSAVMELESVIMCAELHAHRQDGVLEIHDITPFAYHLPSHLEITPGDICALVLGQCDADACIGTRVDIIMLDRTVTVHAHDSVTSDVAR